MQRWKENGEPRSTIIGIFTSANQALDYMKRAQQDHGEQSTFLLSSHNVTTQYKEV